MIMDMLRETSCTSKVHVHILAVAEPALFLTRKPVISSTSLYCSLNSTGEKNFHLLAIQICQS